jgi:hypothetical protein
MKVVVERDGRRQEITGWRAWAIAIPLILLAAIGIATVIVLVLGLAFTAAVILIIAAPAALILALVAPALMSRNAGDGPTRQG